MNKIEEVVKTADLVVNGYAFTRKGRYIRILNLEKLNSAAVIDFNDEVLETLGTRLSLVLSLFTIKEKFYGI